MRRLTRLAAAAAAVALAAVAGASAHPGESAQTFSLTLDGKRLPLVGTHWRPGTVHIDATASRGEQELTLMRFRGGYGYAEFLADGRKAQGHGQAAAAAFRRILAGTAFLGGVDVFPGQRVGFTATVRPGVYYLGELNARPLFRTIRVSGAPVADTAPSTSATIEEYDFGFRVLHGPLPTHGTIAIRNVGTMPHRVNFEPVKRGTTRAQLGAYLRKTGGRPYGPPPTFARRGPELGTAVLGAGESMRFSYDLPAGAYALVSWQKDDPNGKPQALRGMYAVTTVG